MSSDGKKKKQLSLKRKQQTLFGTSIRQRDQPTTADQTESKGPCAQVCGPESKGQPHIDNHGGGAVGRGGYTPQCGLENMGNTCYISAVVQALRCAPGLHRGMTVGHFEVGKVPKWTSAKVINRTSSSTSTDQTLHTEFAKLLCDMRKVEEGEGEGERMQYSLKPEEFVSTTQTIFPQFVRKKQHDAQEFLRCLLGTLQLHIEQTTNQFQLDSDSDLLSNLCSLTGDHDNVVTKTKKRPMISPPTPTLSSKAKRDCLHGNASITSFFKTITIKKEVEDKVCEKEMVVSSDGKGSASSQAPSSQASWVTELFEGTLTSQTCCLECEEKSSREETFLDISVPVSVTAEQVDVLEELKCAPVSLSWSISQYASSEMLCGRDKYWCDCCHHFTEGRKTLYFSKLPKIMTVHLNRFSHKWYQSRFSVGKTVGNIAIPLHLSFLQWCLPSDSSTQKMYELYAIVLHTGSSCTSGHYTTVVKATYSSHPPSQSTSNWLLFNDDRTTLLTQKSFLSMISPLSTSSSSSPYILFYTCVKQTDI